MRAGLRFLTLMIRISTVIDGDFWTGDARRPWAKCLAIDDDGLIVAVEEKPNALAFSFPQAERRELPAGSLGVPAFHDAHNHWGFAAFDHAEPLSGTTFVGDFVAQLGGRGEKSPDGWIIGYGWNTNLLPGLSKSDLDKVSGSRPVAVFDKSTHAVQLNSVAVREIQSAFDAAKADGHPGTLVDGRLLEASFLVFGAMRLPSAALEQSLIDLEQRYLSLGIASLDDMDVLSPQLLDSLQSLYASKRLSLPCHAFLDFGRFAENALPQPNAGGEFQIVGMKSYMDGAFGARSALMNEPFVGTGGLGVRVLDRARFDRRSRAAAERGYKHLALHAIGDRAVKDAVEFLASVSEGGRFERLRVEHFQLAGEADRRRCADAGIAICMQPNFTSDVTDYADRLGDRARRLCEHRSALESGALFGFGSDGMPTGPLHGIRCAVEHPVEEQRLTVEEALRAYTIDSCRISLTDDRRGSLQVGKEANIAVLSRDIVREGRVADDVTVTATMLNGEVRHGGIPLQQSRKSPGKA